MKKQKSLQDEVLPKENIHSQVQSRASITFQVRGMHHNIAISSISSYLAISISAQIRYARQPSSPI